MMRRGTRVRVGIGLAAAVFFVASSLACGGGGSNQAVASLVICTAPLCTGTAGSAKMLTLTEGQPRQVFATARYADGSSKDVTGNSIWFSTNLTCAEVGTGSGLITAAPTVPNACSSDVTASFGPATSSATTVVVTPGTLQTIDLTASTTTPVGGGTMNFTAMGNYAGASQPVDISSLVAWHSDSPSVVVLFSGSGTATVAPVPGQVVHVYASFLGINSDTVRIVVQ